MSMSLSKISFCFLSLVHLERDWYYFFMFGHKYEQNKNNITSFDGQNKTILATSLVPEVWTIQRPAKINKNICVTFQLSNKFSYLHYVHKNEDLVF